jgi:hypothetical protein
MKVKATSMIKFGYVMLFINMALAGIFWATGDRPHTAMFMGGSIVWIIGILIWYRNVESGD